MFEGYDNEEFLYINTGNHLQNKDEDKITFKKGLICDSDRQLICLGEIVPISASRLDKEFKNYMSDIKYWTPLIQGIRIRIYWIAESDEINISTPGRIYPNETILFISDEKIKSQINFALLDKTMCYYAIIERDTQKVILTHMVKNSVDTKNISIDHTLKVALDKAFHWHIELTACLTNEEIVRILTKEKNRQKYGIVFIRNNGEMVEFTNRIYETMRMLEKPDYINYNRYYIYALNKHPQEKQTDFEHYFENDLHYDINNEVLAYFPEYKPYFDNYKQKLRDYIELKVTESISIDEDEEEKECDITDANEYIEVYYEITKSSINPIYDDKYSNETEEEINKLEETVDIKRINFTRQFIEESNIDDILRILT